jgi:tetratricopeptide (TPR) repeat protein
MPLESWKMDLARTIEQHRREGWGWRYDGLESWFTEAIFAQLRELGIDADAQRFHEMASSAGRSNVLDDEWDRQLLAAKKDTGFWRDFPTLAVPVLWQRLARDLVCPEMIGQRLHRVLEAEEKDIALPDVDGLPADLAVAVEVARYLQAFPPAERAARFREIESDSIYDYTGWLIELIEIRGADFADAIVQIADVMSDCAHPAHFQRELAIALALAGRREEAIARANANVARFPSDIWVILLAGDVFEELDDDARAIELWRKALPMAKELYDWEGAFERLEEVCGSAGRDAELQEIVRNHPKPARAPMPRVSAPHRPLAQLELPQPLSRDKKIGRNEPCPCGSGKKFKKCCMP